MNNNLICIEEWVGDSWIFVGVFSDVKLFISKFIKIAESREGDNNKFQSVKIKDNNRLSIIMNYGTHIFNMKKLEINEIY